MKNCKEETKVDEEKKKQYSKNICVACGKEFMAPGRNKYCSKECKASMRSTTNMHEIICKNCGKTVIVYKNAKFCSGECRIYYKNRQAALRKQNNRNKTLTGTEDVDYVTCKICGIKARQLGDAHFKVFHNSNLSKYRKLYPDAKITSQVFKDDNLIGANNPGSKEKTTEQERKERSPFCKEFYTSRNLDLEKRDKMYESINVKRVPNTKLEYYLNKGFDEETAKALLSERQKTGYYGSHSKECTEFINTLLERINSTENYRFGGYEFKLKSNITGKYYFYDFTDIRKKKIIEFNGDFWHAKNNLTEDELTKLHPVSKKSYKDMLLYDNEKYKFAKKNGYTILVVWESEYKKEPEVVMQKCISFLTS